MNKILIDTDILIDFLRTKKGVLLDLFNLQSEHKVELFIASATIVELYSVKSSKLKNPDISEFISSFKIIELTKPLAKFAGELRRDNKLIIRFADLAIGATALFINAKLATRNRKHFQVIPNLKFYNDLR